MSDQSPLLIPFFLSIPISLPPLLLYSLLSFYLSHSLFLPFHSPHLALFCFCFLFPSFPCFLFLLPFLSPSCFPFSPSVLFFLPSPLFPFSLFFNPPLFYYSSPSPCRFLFRPPSPVRLSFPPLFSLFSFPSIYSVPLFPYYWLLFILSLFPFCPFSIYLLNFSGYVSSLFTLSSFIHSVA